MEPAGQHRSGQAAPLAVLIGSLGIRAGSTVAEVQPAIHSMDALAAATEEEPDDQGSPAHRRCVVEGSLARATAPV